MQIISFFSFKGGVGRTALLTNLGVLWAQRGDSVLLVDMDLAAPGLSYSPLAEGWIVRRRHGQGMSNLMAEYYRHFRDNPDADTISMIPPSELLQRMAPPQDSPDWDGRLYLLDAGRAHIQAPDAMAPPQGATSDSRMRPIPAPDDEPTDNPSAALRALATAMREDLAAWRDPKDGRGLDWVFIDCRTGFTELMDLGLGYLADHMVLVSGLNEQNLRGLRLTLEALQQHRVPLDYFPTLTTIVLSPIPAGEDGATLEALDKAHDTVRRALRRSESGLPEAAPEICYVHYNPVLAVSDIPGLLRQAPSLYRREVEIIAKTIDPRLSLDEDPGEVLEEAGRAVRRRVMALLPKAARPSSRPASPDTLPVPSRPAAPSPPTHPQRKPENPLTRLPAWDWPLPPEQRNAQGRRAWLEARGFVHADTTIDRETFLTHLCHSVSLSIAEKQAIFKEFTSLSRSKISEVQENIDNKFVMLSDQSWTAQFIFMTFIYFRQREWLEFLSPNSPEALRHFLTAPLEGRSLFPSWESHPLYWALLSAEWLVRFNDEERAAQALARMEALKPFSDAFVPLAQLMAWNDANNRPLRDFYRPLIAILAPGVPWAAFAYARDQHVQGNTEKVTELLLPLLDTPPNDAELCFQISVFVRQNQPVFSTRSEAVTQHAIVLNPSYAGHWNGLGNLLAQHLHRYDEAEAAYRRAIDLEPKFAYPRNNLGNLLQDHLHRYDEAEAAYRRAIDLDPKDAYPWNGLGNLLKNHFHRYNEAETAYRRAIDLDPKDAASWNGLGNLLCQRGQGAAALDAYSRSVALEQPPRDNVMNRGRLRRCLGQDTEARADLATAASGFATDTNTSGIAHSLFIALLRGAAALEPRQRVQAALEHAPQNLWLYLALLLDALAADRAEALALYEACRTHLPSYDARDTAIEYLYDLAGWRSECAARARAVARDFANLPPEVLARFRDVPVPERLARFQPFLDGESAGAGDPRDRVFYTKDGEPSAVTNDTDSGFS